ncbi:MAG: 2-oxoglutarate dehydrogenase, E2 component, dihydrolipoamide succinyltransferase [Anaerolineales bacterium]
MPTQVLMPQLGEGVDEATITQWLKKEGDTVQELEPIVEVNTDKVDTEIPSPAGGVVLKILKSENETVSVGTVIAIIGQPGEEAESPKTTTPPQVAAPPERAPVPGAPLQGAASSSGGGYTPGRHPLFGYLSPVVAQIANEHGIDLSQIHGSGQDGRITKADVLAYLESAPTPAHALPASAPVPPPTPTAAAAPVPPPTPAAPVPPATAGRLVPHSIMRRRIAEHMLASKHTSPHVLTVFEADLSRVVAHRTANKDAFARDGVRLTYTAYFVAAVAAALKAYPNVNSSWRDDGLLLHPEVNIGMATSLGEDGLIVPVIRNADRLSLLGVAHAVNDLAERARARQLQPGEVQGGTFTITNHGVSGSLFAFPVINQPQCGILGIGKMQKRAIVQTDALGNDSIAIHPMVYLSFVFDHRILDGASADWFVAKVVETLENWQ